MRHGFKSEESDYGSFLEDEISKLAKICGDSLKLGDWAHMFWSPIQFLLWNNTCSTFAKSIIFRDSESSEQERKNART